MRYILLFILIVAISTDDYEKIENIAKRLCKENNIFCSNLVDLFTKGNGEVKLQAIPWGEIIVNGIPVLWDIVKKIFNW